MPASGQGLYGKAVPSYLLNVVVKFKLCPPS